MNLFCNENMQYLLCSCANPIFGKIFVPEIWTKIFSANQIAGFFNQPYLQNKPMKQPGFQHVNTNSHKLKVGHKYFGWTWSKIGLNKNSWKSPMKQGLPVFPSCCLSVFLELDHQISLNFGMMLEILMQLCVTEPNFLEKIFLLQEQGKQAKNRVF